MQRRKRVVGLCGEQFIQSEPMLQGQIRLECPKMWIRTDYSKATIKEECYKICKECNR